MALRRVTATAIATALVFAGAGTARSQPAPGPDCLAVHAEIRTHNQQVAAHNARQASVNQYDAAAVEAYNAEAELFNSRRIELDSAAKSCVVLVPGAKSAKEPTTGAETTPRRPNSKLTRIELQAGATVEQKVNDPEFQDRYYAPVGSNGELRPRVPAMLDANGEPVPMVRQDPENPARYIPLAARQLIAPQFKSGTVQTKMASAQIRFDPATTDALLLRLISVRLVLGWEAQFRLDITETGTVSENTRTNLAAAYRAQLDADAQVGDLAGNQLAAERFPADKFDVQLISDPAASGPGRFDKVYRVTERATGVQQLAIVEELGPHTVLRARPGADGKLHQQGSREYYLGVIENMSRADSPIERDVAELLRQTDTGAITYLLVRAKVDDQKKNGELANQSYGGYTVAQCDLAGS